MTNVLDKIIEDKKESLKKIKEKNSLDSLEKTIKSLNNFLDFQDAISNNNGVSLITEIKKASPSAGELVKDFNHLDIAKMYLDNGATCLSVLTEEKHFLGKLDYYLLLYFQNNLRKFLVWEVISIPLIYFYQIEMNIFYFQIFAMKIVAL